MRLSVDAEDDGFFHNRGNVLHKTGFRPPNTHHNCICWSSNSSFHVGHHNAYEKFFLFLLCRKKTRTSYGDDSMNTLRL
ncbi:hypothetical protein Q1695_008962 [Nippostrongylus brasiliensis]|nr:hypothetical protein Q1695_008962 [Nippostrongylus brasiliensis]